MTTLNHYIDLLAANIDPILVSPANLSGVRRVAALFPSHVASTFGFECRLNQGANRTDFALNLSSEGSRIVANGRPVDPFPEAFRHHPVWTRVSRFYREWGTTNEAPYHDANAVWLEFDLHTFPVSLPTPSLLLFAYWYESNAYEKRVDRPLAWLAQKALPILLQGRSLPAALEKNVLRCLRLGPPGVDYFQIGVPLSRKTDAIRLCFFGIPADQILPFLERSGWRGPLHQVAETITRFTPLIDSFCLHLDVGRELYPRCGLELLYDGVHPWKRQPHKEPRWPLLLARLVESQLCTAGKRDALLAWPGYFRINQLLPAAEEQNGLSAEAGVLLRGLQHLKITCAPGQSPQAKAYFGAAYTPSSSHQVKVGAVL